MYKTIRQQQQQFEQTIFVVNLNEIQFCNILTVVVTTATTTKRINSTILYHIHSPIPAAITKTLYINFYHQQTTLIIHIPLPHPSKNVGLGF